MAANFWFLFYEICVQNKWGEGDHKILRPSWRLTLAVQVQLLLVWNIYLHFNSDIVDFAEKNNEREAENIALLIFVLW